MTSLISSALDLAIPAITNAMQSSSSSSADVAAPPVVSSTDAVAIVPQALPAAPTPIPRPLRSVSSINQPFQALVYDLTGTEQKGWSMALTGIDCIKKYTTPVRDAELLNLEAVIYPSAGALKIPVTVDIAWTPADVAVESKKVICTPGSARFTVGGLMITNSGVLPCDLGYVNPIIKSPIPYVNTPRLNLYFHPNPDAVAQGVKADIKASVFVRGTIRLSNPLLVPQ